MKFLVSSARDLPSRQQTLHRTIGWSYDLLAPNERALFYRFSVFENEVTLDAIEKVCNQNDLDIINLVESLVDKTLIKPNSRGGEIRFTMLEILKEYAREKLDIANETNTIRDRHLGYFQSLVESTETELRKANQIVVARFPG